MYIKVKRRFILILLCVQHLRITFTQLKVGSTPPPFWVLPWIFFTWTAREAKRSNTLHPPPRRPAMQFIKSFLGNQQPIRSALVAHPLHNPHRSSSSDAPPDKTHKKRQAKKNKGIHFGAVHVREYTRDIGESVSGGGPAVGLGWDVYSEKKYKSLEVHEKNVIMARYRDRGQLGRLPPRQANGIIEFQSLQDEYWIPPNKRHHMLLEAGVAQPQVLASVKYLDKLRAERKLSNSDQDALCFALALHHNMTEAEVMARLNPPARQAPAVVSLPDDPPGMEEVLPKTMSLQAKVMIAMKLKKKGKTIRRQSGAIGGNRRQCP
jgi:hypothetical protein